MRKKNLWSVVALGTMALVAACGGKTKLVDEGSNRADATLDFATVGQDRSAVLADAAGAGQSDAAAGSCTPYSAKVNTGKICEDDGDCSVDEICVANSTNTSGSCLGKCCVDWDTPIDDPAGLCVVPDSTKQQAICLWLVEGVTDMACAFICSYIVLGETVKYECPNATDRCVALASAPEISYCDPQ